MTTAQAKVFLLSLLPPGFTRWFNFSRGSDGDRLLEAAAEQLVLRVSDPTDELAANGSPLTLRLSGLAAWEEALGFAGSRTATYGSVDARRAQVLSRLREHGATTLDNVRAIVGPLLGYADPTQLDIVEADRDALRAAHTYSDLAGGPIPPSGFLSYFATTIDVGDDPAVSSAGAFLTLDVDHPSVEDLYATIVGPAGANGQATKTWPAGSLGRGVASGLVVQLFAPEAAGKSVFGGWTVVVGSTTAATGTVNRVDLFVEGVGRDARGFDGLGAAVFEWAVVYDPALGGATYPPDFEAARVTIRRIQQAHTRGYLVRRSTSGGLCAICDDPSAVTDACVCC